jgi:nitrilase
MRASDLPEDFPGKDTLYPDAEEWVNPGDSVVIAPDGEIVAIDLEKARIAKRALDVTGHYSRPDIFQLHVNCQPQSPVNFED